MIISLLPHLHRLKLPRTRMGEMPVPIHVHEHPTARLSYPRPSLFPISFLVLMKLLLAILCASPLLALAIPTTSQYPDILHPDTHTVALDEVNKRMIAFDHTGQELGIYSPNAVLHSHRRRAGQCFPMQNEEIEAIPGINHLRRIANSKWGDGDRNEVANDEHYPERPINVCADDAGALVVFDGEPSCTKVKNEITGDGEGATVFLEHKLGISMKATNTVVRTSKFATGFKASSTFNIPVVGSTNFEISQTFEFTNEQGSSNSITRDLTGRARVKQPVDEGQICTITLDSTICSVTGKASLKMIATGFLWFEYEDPTPPVRGGGRHYKWGLVIERELPNDSDRSSLIVFKTSGDVTTSSEFHTHNCTIGKSLAGHGGGDDDSD